MKEAAASLSELHMPGDSARSARALYALLELSKALSSQVDLDALLDVIVEKTSAVVEAERTSIFVFDPGRGVLWTRRAQGLGSETIEVPLSSGVAGDVGRTLKSANIADAYDDPRFDKGSDARTGFHTRAILASPIVDAAGRLIGVVQSLNKVGSSRFDQADESLMHVVASHIAVAMERTRLTAVHLENERLSESLKVASEIQMRMLPNGTVTLHDNAPFDIHAYIRPAKMVGGDLYDFELEENRLYFCIGDVSGKGIGSALIMALTKTLFRANVPYYDDAARLTEAVNVRLCEETGPTMFVTAFCGFLDLSDGTLRFCNAGHDRPFLLRRGGPVDLLESRPGLALGVLPRFRYPLQQVTLGEGDALFLYTDGVTEATDGSEKLFLIDRVRSTLETCSQKSATEIVSTVVAAVDRFVSNAPQADDITLMCIRYRGAAGRSA